MSQDIVLKREIKTETWLIQGEIAMAASRPEINCVLQYLRDHPNTNAVECSEHLFGDKIGRRVVAERLLSIACLYGLTESSRDQYRLTESGLTALQKGQILVPEDGCWRLCVCSEPLLPHQILTIEAHAEPSAASTGLGKNRTGLNERAKRLVGVPGLVKDIRGLRVEPIGGGKEVRVDKVESKGERISPLGIAFHIKWNVTAGIVEVKRGIDLIFTRRVEPILRQQALKVFLHSEGLLEHWDERGEVLDVAFDETTEVERISMTRAVNIKRPSIHKLGVFNSMALPNISITAISYADAREWAEWRLNNNISMYASANKYENWSLKALAPFKELNFSLPDRAELANKLWSEEQQKRQHAWHVMAAHDWNL